MRRLFPAWFLLRSQTLIWVQQCKDCMINGIRMKIWTMNCTLISNIRLSSVLKRFLLLLEETLQKLSKLEIVFTYGIREERRYVIQLDLRMPQILNQLPIGIWLTFGMLPVLMVSTGSRVHIQLFRDHRNLNMDQGQYALQVS